MSQWVRVGARFALFVIAGCALAHSVPRFKFTETQGPHAVGLKVVDQYDYSRTWRSTVSDLGEPYSGERARPSGEKARAIEFYKKALEKDASDEDAKSKIKELESAPSAEKTWH